MKTAGIISFILLVILFPFQSGWSTVPRNIDAAEIQLALEKMRILGSALYIAAHPDDENTALLAYLSKGKLVRTGYLSITRGDGGQNLIGPESDEILGIIRTQELLAARRIDGAEQFFTSAIDFGYSKSPQEALSIWGEEKILSDVIWIIREFQPDILITRFTPEVGGHGHHRASAMLALEAFNAAGDPRRFPEQLQYVQTWQPKRILWNAWHPALRSQNMDTTRMPWVDLGSYNTLLGKSYGEIAAASRSMHKSQGFGAAPWRGSSREYFQILAGDSAQSDIFEGIPLGWQRIKGGKKIDDLLEKAVQEFNTAQPSRSINLLLQIRQAIDRLPASSLITRKQKELDNIIYACAGLWLEATSDNYYATPGDSLNLTLTALNRSPQSVSLANIDFPLVQRKTLIGKSLDFNLPRIWRTRLKVPEKTPITLPYWLTEKPDKGSYHVSQQTLIGRPQSPPAVTVIFNLQIGKNLFKYEMPVVYKWTDQVQGQRVRQLVIAPAILANFAEKAYIFPDKISRPVEVDLTAMDNSESGTIQLGLPTGWETETQNHSFTDLKKDQTAAISFNTIPSQTDSRISVQVLTSQSGISPLPHMVTIDYPHIPMQTLFPLTQSVFLRLNLNLPPREIGYIMGSGDDVPGILQQLGYEVTLLGENDVSGLDLSKFDAIICGIRAYNTNPWLKRDNSRLLDYVYRGGTLLVQYSVTRGLVLDSLGPYPFRISHERVSVEDAPVSLLIPEHPLLNAPNKITLQDFDGWVQERGLYFADQWDSHYQTPLSSHDPGEEPREGGLLYTTYGKGVYIYTGISFFRQLPAGIPGAITLFVNMVNGGKMK